jgi:threonine synthase
VATSGDTGSAVASGFYNIEGIEVALLYPEKKVSRIQEQQLTTMGGNIHAFEVAGAFDDCQTLVKQAFPDPDLKQKFYLSSANSINIARLLPQSMYYAFARQQLAADSDDLTFCVPSGNFGNLTAGLMAMKMGMPVRQFIAAVNANDVFPQFLSGGSFKAQPAVMTLSNAMDVGNPSNLLRILDLFNHDPREIKKLIYSTSISDPGTLAGIREVYKKYRYIIDPHGAVGYRATRSYRQSRKSGEHIIILETAHPAKFAGTVKEALGMDIEMPDRLASVLKKKKSAQKISTRFEEFKSCLINNFN